MKDRSFNFLAGSPETNEYGQMAELAESGFLLRSCTDVKSVPRVRISLCPPLKKKATSIWGGFLFCCLKKNLNFAYLGF